MQQSLENENFDVFSSATVSDALGLITTEDFDGLVMDLHLQGTEDSCFLVAAIQHFQSKAPIVAVSDSLNIQEAKMAIRLRADVIVKPSNIKQGAEIICAKGLGRHSPSSSDTEECVEEDSRRLA